MTDVGNNEPVKVMMVDDSAIIRGLYRRMIDQDPDVEIVADASNGQLAIDRLKNKEVDIIVLDIEMPVMDGLSAIPHLLKVQPGVMILMASTLTARNAEFSLQALSAGAADYIEKPTSRSELTSGQSFKDELLNKIKALGATAQRRSRRGAGITQSPTSPEPIEAKKKADSNWQLASTSDIRLREPGVTLPRIIAVGSSTGGPQALSVVFGNLPVSLRVPIVVAQHMPPMFTKTLADRINSQTEWSCREAEDGDELTPGTILVAPGGFHMVVAREGTRVVAKLNQEPAVNFCRPAVDPLFISVADVYGAASLAVILTGMGNDGRNGAQSIVEKGGTLYAQDESSSVVWGMPGTVAAAGLCSKVIPLDTIANEMTLHVTRLAS